MSNLALTIRLKMERAIVKQVIASLIDAEYEVQAFYDLSGDDVASPVTSDKDIAINNMFETNEASLQVFSKGINIGWVQFVYGNDGYDVIHDYTTNLDTALQAALDICDKLENGQYDTVFR